MVFLFCAEIIFSQLVFCAEWKSIEGKPAKWGDIIEVALKDLHPTQPCIGFDRNYYKLGRYSKDRRKVFSEFCEKNGQETVRDFSIDSNLHDRNTFACMQPVGTIRKSMKTVVIGPDENLYLTDGHHTFTTYWEMDGGGPDLRLNVVVSRDYRNLSSMAEFWEQMRVEKNIWLFDSNDQPLTPANLPKTLSMKNFCNDPFRALMYFTRHIAWSSPGTMNVPEPQFFDDDYPDVPFVEFWWMREIRDKVHLSDYDLNTKGGTVAAIRAVGEAIVNVQSTNVGSSGFPAKELGQFSMFNNKELARISRPGTGKLDYMLAYKALLKRNALIK